MSNECIPELNRLCRLCGERDELISIFSVMYLDLSASLQDLIYESVSVKVEKDDCISRNICAKCMKMVVEIFKFRRQAIENDQSLKEQQKLAIKRNEDIEIAIDQQNISNNGLYKEIKLPNGTFNVFSDPFVVMDFGVVEDYFRKKKLNMKLHMVAAKRNYRIAKRLRVENLQKRLSIQMRKPTKQQQSSDNNIKISDTITVEEVSPIDSITASSTHQSSSNDNQATSSTIDPISSTDSSTSQQSSIDNNPVTNTKSFSNILKFDTRCTQAHMCRICNIVFNKRCHLKKHLLNHLICQFCKKKFKTQEDKGKHISNECKVRNAISGASTLHVPLQKIEQNLKTVEMYYPAFKMFSEILPVDFKADDKDEFDKEDDSEPFRLYIELDDEVQSNKEDVQDPTSTIIECNEEEISVDHEFNKEEISVDHDYCNKEEISVDHDDQELVNLITKSFKESDSKENNLRLEEEQSSPNIDHLKEKELDVEINDIAIKYNEISEKGASGIFQPFKLTHGPLKSTLMNNYNNSRLTIIKSLLQASNKFKAKAQTDIGTQTILVPGIKIVKEDTKFGPVLLDNALHTLSTYNIPVKIKSNKHVVISCKREITSPPLKLEDWDHLPLNDIEVEVNETVVTSEKIS